MSKRKVVSLAVSVALLAAVIISVFAVSGPAALLAGLSQLAPSSIAAVVLLLTAGLLLSALRLKLITGDLGYSLSMRDATATLSVGQLAGSLFFQLAGQLIGRGAMLARRGIPPAASVVISGYERIFALFVSLILAACGATYLFRQVEFRSADRRARAAQARRSDWRRWPLPVRPLPGGITQWRCCGS